MFFLVDLPFQEHEVADYERRRYRGWDQRIVNRREMYILKKLLRLVTASPSAQIPAFALDAPCGYGRFTRLLVDRHFRMVSSDLSLAMVQRARAKDTTSGIPIGVVANLTEGLPFRAGAFGLVFSMRLFHHLHQSADRRRALVEFARISEVWTILSYYQTNPLHRLQRALRRKIKKSKTRIKMIRRRELREEAQSAGLEVVKIRPLFRGIHAQHIVLLKKFGA